MVSSTSTPWYLAPARPFPVKVWLERRFGFRVSIPPSTQQAGRPADADAPPDRRPFPAQVWLAAQQGTVAAVAHRQAARSGNAGWLRQRNSTAA